MEVFPSDILKLATMSGLQEQVALRSICPRCHTKSLRFVHEGAGMRFTQCESCLSVYVLVASESVPQTHPDTGADLAE